MSISTSFQSKTAIIDITVQPKSSRSIIKCDGTTIKVYLNSPPVEGKANNECITLLSKALGLPKSRIEIFKGEKGKKKRIAINGLSTEEVYSILTKATKV
jgi:uncharacterized protein